MGIAEKIAHAKKTSWVTEGLSDAEVKTIVELAKISAQIERSRLEMNMTQQQFAEHMGVSQGMISKWESREYNFTIKTLNEICQKLDLKMSVHLERPYAKSNYTLIKWDEERVTKKKRNMAWLTDLSDKGAIA